MHDTIRARPMITLYGINNCDTVRKARRWLEANGIDYTFHDIRAQGLEPDRLDGWIAELGWENLLNRRGATWRRLPESVRAGVDDAASARRLMLEHPALIRRPLLDAGGTRHIGFAEADYRRRLSR